MLGEQTPWLNGLHMNALSLAHLDQLVGVVDLFLGRILSAVFCQSFEAQVVMFDDWKSVLMVLVCTPPKYNKDSFIIFLRF